MREILFRGKDVAGNWHYGVPLVFFENFVCITDPHTYNKAVVPETVGQFTGLTDKNGKRIFEGDIVKDFIPFNFTLNGKKLYKENVYVVEYCEQKCGFNPFCLEGYDGIPIIEQCEIVGNRFDNPELLTAERNENGKY